MVATCFCRWEMVRSTFSVCPTHLSSVAARMAPLFIRNGPKSQSDLLIPLRFSVCSGTQLLGALSLTSLVATAAADSTIALWNTDEWTSAHVFSEFKYPSRSLGFSYDGEWLAAGGEDTEVHIVRFS